MQRQLRLPFHENDDFEMAYVVHHKYDQSNCLRWFSGFVRVEQRDIRDESSKKPYAAMTDEFVFAFVIEKKRRARTELKTIDGFCAYETVINYALEPGFNSTTR